MPKAAGRFDALGRTELPVWMRSEKRKGILSEAIFKESRCPQIIIVIQAGKRPSSAVLWRLPWELCSWSSQQSQESQWGPP